MGKKMVIGVSFVAGMLGALGGRAAVNRIVEKKEDKNDTGVLKFKSQFYMLNRWLQLEQQGKNIAEYLEDNGYHKIAIYGMGSMGERIIDDLKKTKVEIAFGIDEKADARLSEECSIYSLEDCVDKNADVIVVSAIFAYQDIKAKIESCGIQIPIISLEDVIYSM